MWDLIKIVIPKIKADWKCLADSLQYDIPTIKEIDKTSLDSGQCCEKLFEDWLSTNHGAAPKTWQTLLQKTKEVDILCDAAYDIERELNRKFTSRHVWGMYVKFCYLFKHEDQLIE